MFDNVNGGTATTLLLVGGAAVILLTVAVTRRILHSRKTGTAPARAQRWVDTSERTRATGSTRTSNRPRPQQSRVSSTHNGSIRHAGAADNTSASYAGWAATDTFGHTGSGSDSCSSDSGGGGDGGC